MLIHKKYYLKKLFKNKNKNTRCRLFNVQGFFVHNNAVAQKSYAHLYAAQKRFSLCLLILRSMRVTHLGVSLRVIVNEKKIKILKRRHLVFYVLLLLNLCIIESLFRKLDFLKYIFKRNGLSIFGEKSIFDLDSKHFLSLFSVKIQTRKVYLKKKEYSDKAKLMNTFNLQIEDSVMFSDGQKLGYFFFICF